MDINLAINTAFGVAFTGIGVYNVLTAKTAKERRTYIGLTVYGLGVIALGLHHNWQPRPLSEINAHILKATGQQEKCRQLCEKIF